MPGHLVAQRGHVRDARRIDPVVVELKERADGYRVVERLIGPTGLARTIHVLLANGSGVANHLLDKGVKRPVLVGDRRAVEIIQDTLYQSAIPVQLRRDRGVGANSEQALIELRSKGRDELALPGRQGRRAAHHSLREQRQELGSLGLEREQMQDLGNRDARSPHLPEHRRVRLGSVVVLYASKVHRLHISAPLRPDSMPLDRGPQLTLNAPPTWLLSQLLVNPDSRNLTGAAPSRTPDGSHLPRSSTAGYSILTNPSPDSI